MKLTKSYHFELPLNTKPIDLIDNVECDSLIFDKENIIIEFKLTIDGVTFNVTHSDLEGSGTTYIETKIDDCDGFMELRKTFLRELIDEHERKYYDDIRDFYFDNTDYYAPSTYGMSWGDFLSR